MRQHKKKKIKKNNNPLVSYRYMDLLKNPSEKLSTIEPNDQTTLFLEVNIFR